MTSAMTAFGIAVGGTSLMCYVLMTRRLQNGERKRGSSGDSSGSDGGDFAGGDGWRISDLFGGDHSASHGSGDPNDSSGGDSGGGGDGGGGDGGD